jgi:hypothetical protein
VDGAEPGAGQHGDGRFRDHRHVDDDPVALLHALGLERARDLRDLVQQFRIGILRDRAAGDGAVVDQRGLIGAAAFDVAVQAVVAGVQLATREPAVERCIAVVQDLVPFLRPCNRLGGVSPEPLGVVDGPGVGFLECVGHVCLSRCGAFGSNRAL